MPPEPNHPGVYVEEAPSGVRTITGVATSITAFLGRARRGPVNTPVRVQSFADYTRLFGGLWQPSTMSYAVSQFFQNGGRDALIVRLFNGDLTASTPTITLPTATGALVLEAASPGSWGNALRAHVRHPQDAPDPDPLLFNLVIEELDPSGAQVVASERFDKVSVSQHSARFVDTVLNEQSTLVRMRSSAPATERPTATDGAVPAVGTPNDGDDISDHDIIGDRNARTGMFALEAADLFNLLCIPPRTPTDDLLDTTWAAAAHYCHERRAVLIVDTPADWTADPATAIRTAEAGVNRLRTAMGNDTAANAAAYFPRLRMPDPLRDNRLADFAPCGAVAGIIARTDVQRGVWKAPAGVDAAFSGVQGLTYTLTDEQNGVLNPLGLNCLRTFPDKGNLVWGARTLAGADGLASEWKYLNVRRLALFLEESLFRGTRWAVFERNDEPLWAQIRLNVGAFMQTLFREGAFQGTTPREAYLVKCDRETTTQHDIDRGIVNILVGFAPLKPAEFVIIRIQQTTGQVETQEAIAATQLRAIAQRFDPYKNFKFRVKMDGRYVAGVSKVSTLKRSTETVEHRKGSGPSTSRKSPERAKFEAITLERGITHDAEFEQWANQVSNADAGTNSEPSLKDLRKDLIIEAYDQADQLVLAYKVYRCWVSEFQAVPELDANANAVGIERIKLENEGWERA